MVILSFWYRWPCCSQIFTFIVSLYPLVSSTKCCFWICCLFFDRLKKDFKKFLSPFLITFNWYEAKQCWHLWSFLQVWPPPLEMTAKGPSMTFYWGQVCPGHIVRCNPQLHKSLFIMFILINFVSGFQ